MSEYNYDEFIEKPHHDNILADINRAVIELKESELLVAQCEELLKAAQKKVLDLREFIIPELMEEAEQTMIITASGTEVKMVEKIHASITASNQRKAIKWLSDNGHSSIVKRQFIIEFGKNEEEWATEFEQELKKIDHPLNVKRKENVHNATLRSFVKEQLEEGVAIPLDIFGVHRQRIANVK